MSVTNHPLPLFVYNEEEYSQRIARMEKNAQFADSVVLFKLRYIPGEYDDITKEEYEKAVKIAKDCLAWVEKKVSAIETADTTPIGGIINKEQ